MQNAVKILLTALLAFNLIFSMTGCSTVSAAPQRAAAGSMDERAKQVFLLQARVADDLLDRYPFADLAMDPALAAAESRMTARCAAINQVALSHVEGAPIGLELQLKVFAGMKGCEAAAHDLSDLLAAEDGQTLATAETVSP